MNGTYSRLVRRQLNKAKPARIMELIQANGSDEDSSSHVSEKSSGEEEI